MLNSKGFILIEVLVTTVILLTILLLLSPLFTQLLQERKALKDRRMISAHLHDELQKKLWQSVQIPETYEKDYHGRTLTFQFSDEQEMIKGCVSWKNAKQKEESFCLYGYGI